jgi:hypothetical protein
MKLSELKWESLLPRTRTAIFKRPGCRSRLDDGVIYEFNEGEQYMVTDRRVPPRRHWIGLDAATAQCILMELTKSPHDADDNPER